MKATYHSFHLLPVDFLMMMGTCLASMLTQKCGNFVKTALMTPTQSKVSFGKICLSKVNISMLHFECTTDWSAHLTQRSRLFICVDTNSSCKVVSSIASAVWWVNSGQSVSGKSISIGEHYLNFPGRNIHCSHLPIAHMPWEDIWYPKL